MLPTIEFKPKPQETVRIRDLKPGMCFRVPGGGGSGLYQRNDEGGCHELGSGVAYNSAFWPQSTEVILVKVAITCTKI